MKIDSFYREFSIILLGGKLLPCSLRHEINLSGDLVFPSFYHLVLASIMYLTTSCIALHTKSNQKICREQSKNLLVHWPSFMLYKAEKKGGLKGSSMHNISTSARMSLSRLTTSTFFLRSQGKPRVPFSK